ncbi:MAG: hypothetical protein LPH21_12215 [Shewanella sp.]|nr:hypothetical protein [Shewanella sp.]MCF1458281.1 hypothetical protein [Shewanella sp.]
MQPLQRDLSGAPAGDRQAESDGAQSAGVHYLTEQSGQFHQSIRKIQLLRQQSFGLYFSTGALSKAQARVLTRSIPTHQSIHAKVNNAELVHAYQTRHQRGGSTHWMCVACFLSSKIMAMESTANGGNRLVTITQGILVDPHSNVSISDTLIMKP